jgi:hypothetical protein
MMVDYIPKELDTWEKHNKHLEICDHLSRVATALSARIKAERNIDRIMIDDDEVVEKIAQVIKRSARQSLEFTKEWLTKEGLYTTPQ